MNKRLKSVIACILILALSLSIGTISAFAASSNGFEYEVVNGEAVITGYTGTSSALNIPSSLNGYPVTAIGEKAFFNCENIGSITIPSSVTRVGREAFWGTGFFKDKGNWDNNTYLYIGDVLVDSEYTTKGSCAVKEGTRVIAEYAFYLSGGITSVSIPKSVKYVGRNAFDCSGIETINVDSSNPYFTSVSGVLFNKNKTELIAFPNEYSGMSYKVPDGVKTIGSGAFAFCKNLTKITLPNSITTIGEYAFQYCESLTSFNVPDNLKVIPKGMFDHCGALSQITMSSGVTLIDTEAFVWCSGLTEITLARNLKTIGERAFYECRNLKSISVPKSVTTIKEAAFYDCTKLADVNYEGSQSEWSNISIGLHNDRIKNASKRYNVNIFGGTGMSPDLPTEPSSEVIDPTETTDPVTTVPATTEPAEPSTPAVTEPSEGTQETKQMCIYNYNKSSYSASTGGFLIGESEFGFYHIPSTSTLVAKVKTNTDENSIVKDVTTDLPYEFNVDGIYYMKQISAPYGYILDENWYRLEVTKTGFILTDCSTDIKVSYSNRNNNIIFLSEAIVGDVVLSVDAEEAIGDSILVGDYEVKNAETDETAYFDNYYRWKGYAPGLGANKFKLYSDSFIALSDLPVGEYYFEKIISETNDAVNSERIYFEIKPNESGVDCDLVKIAVKLEYKPSQPYPVGDVNRDGKFNIKDATAVQKYLAHMIEAEDIDKENADFNGDGKINVKDATTIQKSLAGLLGSISGVSGSVSQGPYLT